VLFCHFLFALFLSKLYVIQAQSVMSALKWVRDSKACLNAVAQPACLFENITLTSVFLMQCLVLFLRYLAQ